MMENAKRPNLAEIVTVSPNPYASIETGPTYPGGKNSVSSLASVGEASATKTRQPSKLAMAGSLNILSTKGSGAPLIKQNDEERLKKVMLNMEKEKSLQFR